MRQKERDRARGFRVQTYGRTELAQMYCPDLTPGGAWRKLMAWIAVNPRLRGELMTADGRMKGRLRTFTPREVGMIVEELGEP